MALSPDSQVSVVLCMFYRTFSMDSMKRDWIMSVSSTQAYPKNLKFLFDIGQRNSQPKSLDLIVDGVVGC